MEHLVDGSWLEEHLSHDDLRVLDCHVVFKRMGGALIVESGRSRWELGHIPGSNHLDLIGELSDTASEFQFMMPSPDQIADVMSGLGVGRGTRVVLYDRDMNMWAARVWWVLRAVGFDDAAVLDGGWRAWRDANRPVTTDVAPEYPRGKFIPIPRPELFVGKREVLTALSSDQTLLVNALGESEHRGDTVDYGRRGHIPTAVNVPAASLVDAETHAYLDEETLRVRMAAFLGSGATHAITYCGGGISAASDAFVLSMLGQENVAIYDASMGEWGSDPSLPLTVPG